MTLKDKIDQLRKATPEAQEKALLDIVDRNKNYLVDLNTAQLFAGKDNQDAPLRPPYRSRAYAEFKRSLNPAGVVDLRLTGRFWDSFYADTTKFPVGIFASDEKTGELVSKYGKELFDLGRGSKAELADHLREEIIGYYKREVFNV